MHRLLLCLSFLATASAAFVPLKHRGFSLQNETIEDYMGNAPNVTTLDHSAGIGAEFETAMFTLVHKGCAAEDSDQLKGAVIGDHKDENSQWALTADTTSKPDQLHAEYIFYGQNIKVGSGDAAKAGAVAAKDFVNWSPWAGDDADNIKIGDGVCDPWKIQGASKNWKAEDVTWDAQVTAPMPLEGVYSLMQEQQQDPQEHNILDGYETIRTGAHHSPGGVNLVVVTKDFFQTSPNGIAADKVTDDVLGFCSLVLSYAKGVGNDYLLRPGESVKLMTTFMPRTEFNTIFKQVKSKISGDLYDLFNILACYQSAKSSGSTTTTLDKTYCSGSVTKPVPNGEFAKLNFQNSENSVNVKTWIQGIGTGSGTQDALSNLDSSLDKSIGGLGTQTENMYKTQRAVPLFEFRDLPQSPTTSGFEKFLNDADEAVLTLHEKFASVP
ncbi:hypothetical protein M406DRAFT_73634 [Cryphonectria parasitica EP155]|uniref:Uncharacterized protein n=1 Tax=Cryphonectria parasitica (strain ATCC 38755 / EP155) TaxID=660469 RepID=A0A9P4XTU1_CRYP1|nr:uncharacterized protein M406DRAFT_73634 [Cryphonectria parasitica EP155]KAF3761199.1 hypothetical protein M406DRAFT_73634 [Cryphonectria parasitica EP155]